MSEPERERGYRKWKKAVALTLDWVDEDDDDEADFPPQVGIAEPVGIAE